MVSTTSKARKFLYRSCMALLNIRSRKGWICKSYFDVFRVHMKWFNSCVICMDLANTWSQETLIIVIGIFIMIYIVFIPSR